MSNKTPTRSTIGRVRAEAIPDDRLLFTRKQVMRMLGGISYPTVIRLEQSGKLPPVKLRAGKTCKTFYRRCEVMALIPTSPTAND
ncbi:hypothetical protein IQ16_08203 [Bradyrhizobium huanghuaihaiense]|uniref:AlpA family transcriptional regulator n=1 Tax=Bradyrhizobium huanghuaihaiense TaxID=990078 RepID=A0A562QNI8_9BRAD|nr:hypothetical protein IQ16_08203 [Bradyrhizobium huanghuaihaiense]